MTLDLAELGIRAILLDVEGTTTPIAFVHEVLFPYARARLGSYLRDHEQEAHEAVTRLVEEAARPLDGDQLIAFVESLMDRDVKSPGLKQLQGLIWRQGYAIGDLAGEVFDDVPPAFERWKRAGFLVAIYSSGSVLAQQLLFSTVPGPGSLTAYIDRYFDTAVGPKTSAASYTRVADAMDVLAGQLLFVSDSPAELIAARAAGCQVAWSIRPGNPESTPPDDIPAIASFNGLLTG